MALVGRSKLAARGDCLHLVDAESAFHDSRARGSRVLFAGDSAEWRAVEGLSAAIAVAVGGELGIAVLAAAIFCLLC